MTWLDMKPSKLLKMYFKLLRIPAASYTDSHVKGSYYGSQYLLHYRAYLLTVEVLCIPLVWDLCILPGCSAHELKRDKCFLNPRDGNNCLNKAWYLRLVVILKNWIWCKTEWGSITCFLVNICLSTHLSYSALSLEVRYVVQDFLRVQRDIKKL